MNSRANTLARSGLLACAVVLILAVTGCGGGGGDGGGGGGQVPTATPTLGRNSTSASNNNGSTTIAVDQFELIAGGGDDSRTAFRVILRTPGGAPIVNALVRLQVGAGLVVLSPETGSGRTDSQGMLEGEIQGIAGGTFKFQAVPDVSTGLPPVDFNILVFGSALPPTATATQGGGNGTVSPAPTVTPTAVPVDEVAKIIVQAQPFRISSAVGGELTITILAFDENNIGLRGVRLLLEADPVNGVIFDPITPITNSNGIATSTMLIEPDAEVGEILVTASAGTVVGTVPITVVSGISERPVATVVLETDQPVIGTDSGGTASLKARVFDVDNIGIPNVNVLFITEIGQVSPPVEVSCGGNLNPCPPTETGLAQTTLTVPPAAVIRDYALTALAGGVEGTASISIVNGRGGIGTGNPNAAAGEPASLTLGASPTAIQVTGTGGTEQATVIARIFDNNNNPLSGRVVALRIVPDVSNGAQMLPLSGTQPPLPTKCLEDPARRAAYDQGRVALGISDRAGFVLASMRAGTLKGTVTVDACADSINADESVSTVVARQSVVTVAAGPPAVVSVVMNNVFVDNNDGTLFTTVAALVKDANGNTVEDSTAVTFSVVNRQDVSIVGGSITNDLPNCDIDQVAGQTGIPITAQPGTAITCIFYPAAQAGTVVRLRAESGGITNEQNNVQDEDFNLPPGQTTGPANGTPSARNFSLASEFLNLAGRVTFGLDTTITAFIGDRNGNPVARNTVVHFTSTGGGVTSQNVTNLLGRTTAQLTTQGPVPENGIAVVTATVMGEEDFDDVNGNGEFDPGVDGFNPAIHDQDGDGEWSELTEISTEIPILFSGTSRIDIEPDTFTLHNGEVQCFDVRVSDAFGNPLVGGTAVNVSVVGSITLLGSQTSAVPDSSRPCDEAPGACNFSACVFPSGVITDPSTVGVTFSVLSSTSGAGANGNVGTSAVGSLVPSANPEP